MLSLRVLARILLVVLLLTDGVVGAAAATEMATQHAVNGDAVPGHAAHDADAKPASGCQKSVEAPTAGGEHDATPLHCSCSDERGCNCNFLLTLHPGRLVLLFGLERSTSVHSAIASFNPPRLPIASVFRPPIG